MKQHSNSIVFLSFVFLASVCRAWVPGQRHSVCRPPQKHCQQHASSLTLRAASIDKKPTETEPTPEETTKRFGLEAGLFQSLKQENGGGESAKSLLKRYGIAYLATSIPLALMSFAICYFLVDNGADVAGMLQQVGIEANSAGEKAGTFALAYAAHKAASPIRFPPTVILTPIVAKLIGKEPVDEEKELGL